MLSKLILGLLFLLMIPATGHGESRGKFNIGQEPKTDLLDETSRLKLQNEQPISVTNPPSPISISVLGGVTEPHNLKVVTNGVSVPYGQDLALPLLTFQFDAYFLRKHGVWGAFGSAGYSYSEHKIDGTTTALHLLPGQISALYRGEFKDTQFLIPAAGFGLEGMSYFQRGIDQLRTSSIELFPVATASVAVNLNRLKLVHSRNDTEVLLQYQRSFGNRNPDLDFTGDTFQIGGTLAL